mmetsp:Transcript_39181/g.63779  ORF Transcript_39181/g.63779 Transcript_39181/m.63779 type:complete len:492 (-) Transcript_39181:731-2206(-)
MVAPKMAVDPADPKPREMPQEREESTSHSSDHIPPPPPRRKNQTKLLPKKDRAKTPPSTLSYSQPSAKFNTPYISKTLPRDFKHSRKIESVDSDGKHVPPPPPPRSPSSKLKMTSSSLKQAKRPPIPRRNKSRSQDIRKLKPRDSLCVETDVQVPSEHGRSSESTISVVTLTLGRGREGIMFSDYREKKKRVNADNTDVSTEWSPNDSWIRKLQSKSDKVTSSTNLEREWLSNELNITETYIRKVDSLMTRLKSYKSALQSRMKSANMEVKVHEPPTLRLAASAPASRTQSPRISMVNVTQSMAVPRKKLSNRNRTKNKSLVRIKMKKFSPIKNVRKFITWAIRFFRKKRKDRRQTSLKESPEWTQGVRRKSSVVFRRGLEDLIRQEDGSSSVGVPRIVIQTLDTLWRRGIQVEGIFRKSGNAEELREIARQIDSNKEINWDSVDIHVVAGILKKFLRNLSDPLIPSKMSTFSFAVAKIYNKCETMCAYCP